MTMGLSNDEGRRADFRELVHARTGGRSRQSGRRRRFNFRPRLGHGGSGAEEAEEPRGKAADDDGGEICPARAGGSAEICKSRLGCLRFFFLHTLDHDVESIRGLSDVRCRSRVGMEVGATTISRRTTNERLRVQDARGCLFVATTPQATKCPYTMNLACRLIEITMYKSTTIPSFERILLHLA